MTHDKVRQDFEAHYTLHRHYTPVWFEQNADGDYVRESGQLLFNGFKEGRAAERAEIREKLESEGVEETIATALINGLRFHKGCTTAVTGTLAMLDDDARSYKAEAKAAITKILEVI